MLLLHQNTNHIRIEIGHKTRIELQVQLHMLPPSSVYEAFPHSFVLLFPEFIDKKMEKNIIRIWSQEYFMIV